jgi:hypothetical protein
MKRNLRTRDIFIETETGIGKLRQKKLRKNLTKRYRFQSLRDPKIHTKQFVAFISVKFRFMDLSTTTVHKKPDSGFTGTM